MASILDINGLEEVSLLVRCPHISEHTRVVEGVGKCDLRNFRGRNACKSGTWGGKRCPV